MIRAVALAALVALAACQPQEEPDDGGLAGYDPNLIERQRAACAERGGNFTRAGLADAFVCVEATGDGGKSCRAASDCEGLCLARSRSCAPIKPLFGCHEVLTRAGAPATICID